MVLTRSITALAAAAVLAAAGLPALAQAAPADDVLAFLEVLGERGLVTS